MGGQVPRRRKLQPVQRHMRAVQIDRVAIFKQASRSSRFVLLDNIPLG